VVLRVVVLLLVLAVLGRRFLPRYRLPWLVPVVLVGVVLAVRSTTYLVGDGAA
jgi:hypothetical protein